MTKKSGASATIQQIVRPEQAVTDLLSAVDNLDFSYDRGQDSHIADELARTVSVALKSLIEIRRLRKACRMLMKALERDGHGGQKGKLSDAMRFAKPLIAGRSLRH